MLRAHGYGYGVSEAGIFEVDTVQCGHCSGHINTKPLSASTVYIVYDAQGNPHEEPGAFCRVCMRAVCLKPSCCEGGCVPFEKKLERAEARDRFLRSVFLG